MKPREQYLENLRTLRKEILRMGVLVEEALRKSIKSLVDQDTALAAVVVDDDEAINAMELDIEDKSTVLIAKEQPVASDLRNIITGLKIVTQLERMGDHAVHIAKTTLRIAGESYIKPLIDIPRMGEVCVRMAREVLTAFIDDDIEKARMVATMDEEVDDLHAQVQRELFTHMMEDATRITQAIQLLFVSRYLERFADHITNISEWIIYGQTGDHVELNR
jgi:phosphate transport system protein